MKIRLAGLLHDIGKFYQRTKTTLPNVELYQRYINSNNTYRHAGYTACFIDNYLSDKLENVGELIDLASNHHRVNDSIISKADKIAAAHDRKDANRLDINDESEFDNGRMYYQKRMQSIFSEVQLKENQKNEIFNVKLKPLSDFDIVNESSYDLDNSKSIAEYKDLFNEFVDSINEREIKKKQELIELHDYLYPLIKEYTTAIPANTYQTDFSTVSLFDHLKLTAAVASCISINDKELIMLDYDLSGIQNFIFKITEGESTKKDIESHLRSRSFFLSLLADAVAFKILKEFNLSYENILFSSGGRGSILLPSIDNLDNKLHAINKEIEEYLFFKYKGELSISLKYWNVKPDDFKNESISEIRRNRDNIVEISSKQTKFADILSTMDSFVFSPMNGNVCKLCGSNEALDDSALCEECQTFSKINKFLSKNQEFIIGFGDYDSSASLSIKLDEIGNISFYTKEDFKYNKNNYYISYNNNLIGESKNYAMHDKLITFEGLAKTCRGDNKIAVIKMDVDNLGYIFANGIRKSTISKNLTLSRMMDLYFTKIIKDNLSTDKFKDKVYINYSGGDDLLIITPADISLEVANQIIKGFKNFNSNNVGINISCGVEILKPQSPIRFAVLRANDNLDNAKAREGKNSLCVIDAVIPNNEIDDVINKSIEFEELMNSNKISRTNLYRIYTYLLRALESKGNTLENYQKNIPHIAYSIKRNVKDEDAFTKLKKMFVRNDITTDEIEKNKIILGYCLMNTREKEN